MALRDLPDALRARLSRRSLLWLFPLLPWSWFVVREAHWLFEIAALLLPPVLGLGLIASIFVAVRARLTVAAVTAVSIVIVFAGTVIGPTRALDRPLPTSSMKLLSMNLRGYWFSNNDAGFLISQTEPAIVIGTELTESHDEEFQSRFENSVADIISLDEQRALEDGGEPAVDEGYRRFGFFSLGVYSDFPLELLDDPIDEQIEDGLPGFRIRVDAPTGPFILYALHVPRPGTGGGVYEVSMSEQVEMLEAIDESIQLETEPVVVMGDLNISDRSSMYRRLTSHLEDGLRANRRATPTSDRSGLWPLLYLRVDHLLVSPDLCVQNPGSQDVRYSDHDVIFAEVGPCPSSSVAASPVIRESPMQSTTEGTPS